MKRSSMVLAVFAAATLAMFAAVVALAVLGS